MHEDRARLLRPWAAPRAASAHRVPTTRTVAGSVRAKRQAHAHLPNRTRRNPNPNPNPSPTLTLTRTRTRTRTAGSYTGNYTRPSAPSAQIPAIVLSAPLRRPRAVLARWETARVWGTRPSARRASSASGAPPARPSLARRTRTTTCEARPTRARASRARSTRCRRRARPAGCRAPAARATTTPTAARTRDARRALAAPTVRPTAPPPRLSRPS